AAAGMAGMSGAAMTGKPVVYIGGSGATNYPFTTYDFDPETGAFKAKGGTTNLGPGPSYIALAPSKQFLVVTNEEDDATGGLTSAAIGADGTLTKLNHVTGTDGGFTYVAIHPAGYVFGASYNGGSLTAFPLRDDGVIGSESDSMDFGAMAQTHCVGITSDGMHLLVPNKGNDEVAQLLFDADGGTLSANTPPSAMSVDGAGPRHIAIHPNGKLAFVINELDSTMTPYALATNGTLTRGMSVSTLPSSFNGMNTGAHVELSPDGKFAYGSNRGHDSIVVFSIDQTSGALTLVQHQPSGGKTPRDFDMDPYGRFIVVANQGDSKLAAFSIGTDGKLAPLGSSLNGPNGCSAVQIAYLDQ
ncbi:MAG TPA: lactonase family protein, partial [Polyangiaceae bacterium]|nr:lactonase family protein [Polyangiaceae bacterium]